MKTSVSYLIILHFMGLLLISSCISFQERTKTAQQEICEYSFERCALQRLEMLAAALNHRGKVYLFTEDAGPNEYGNTFQILNPSFDVKINPDSDAVVLLYLIHEAEKKYIIPEPYPGQKVITIYNTERVIFSELEKYLDKDNNRILTKDSNLFVYLFKNVDGKQCMMADYLFPLHVNSLCPNDNYIYKNQYKMKYFK